MSSIMAHLYRFERTDIPSTDSNRPRGYEIIVIADNAEIAEHKAKNHANEVVKELRREKEEDISFSMEEKMRYSVII